jgi:ABC-type lipoprotein export system ATPase subunit
MKIFSDSFLDNTERRALTYAILTSLGLGIIEIIGYFPFAWIIQQIYINDYHEFLNAWAMLINASAKSGAIILLFIILIFLASSSILSNYLLYKNIWLIYKKLSLKFTKKIFYSNNLSDDNISEKTKILIYEVQTVTHNYLLAKSNLISRGILTIIMIGTLFYVNFKMNGLIIFISLATGSVAYFFVRIQLKKIGKIRLLSSESTFSMMTSIIKTALHLRSYGSYEKHLQGYLEPQLDRYSSATAMNSFLPVIPRSVVEFSFFISILVFIALPNSIERVQPIEGLISIFLFVRLLPISIVVLRTSGEIAFSASARKQLEYEWCSQSVDVDIPYNDEDECEKYCLSIQLHSVGPDTLHLEFETGKLNVITGESGIGKSTILKAIQNIPSSNLGSVDRRSFVGASMHVTPQKGQILSWASIRDNLFLQEKEFGNSTTYTQLIDELNLKQLDLFDEKPLGNLSGGQEKRLDLLRALIHQSSILLLDEPTAGLDQGNALKVIELLKNTNNRTIIAVSHEQSLIAVADNIIHIEKR